MDRKVLPNYALILVMPKRKYSENLPKKEKETKINQKLTRLRGVGADVVIMEEAAFMDTKVFYEVIVPLLEVENTGK